MKQKKKLVLVDNGTMSNSTRRIFDMTRDTCERFNNYYLDFFESIVILHEKKEAEPFKGQEIEEQISYMKNKINELSGFMHELADKMPGLVEVVDIE